MSSQPLPKMLKYKTIKPKGFPSEFKRFEVMPQSSSMSYNLNDIIRFQFKTDWYFDPFQTYMDIEVEFPQDDQNMGVKNTLSGVKATGAFAKKKLNDIPVFSLDGPATSLIEEMILYSNNKEVERVQNYDVIGNLISDIGVPALSRQNKKFEGYGYAGLINNQASQAQQGTFDSEGYKILVKDGKYSRFPLVTSDVTENTKTALTYNFTNWNVDYDLWGREGITNTTDIQKNSFRNLAREYVLNDGSFGIDTASTKNSNPIYIPYDAGDEDDLSTQDINTLSDKILTMNNRCVENFDSSLNHFDYICPGITAQKWYQGKPVTDVVFGAADQITDTSKQLKYGVYKKTFHVPILSGVMGHLIPADQWKLIPGSGCGEMTWEFRLNKYAFFASGHLDNDDLAGTGEPTKQFNMNWKVTNISLRFDLWNFDNGVNQSINSQINSSDGVLLTSQGFASGPIQQIASTSQVRNIYQINNGILSMKNVYIMFLLNDYMKYNYCRKNFRISQCLKSIQLKMGNDFLPKQPILGNAGKLTSSLKNDDVYPFLMELYRSQGEMFSTYNTCTISPFSFMVNDRCYNPTNKQETINQSGLWQEQRLNGKAVYTIDTTADPFDMSVLTGLDTTKVRPIELMIDIDTPASEQTRSSTMYILLHHDTIVQFTSKGIQTICYA